MLPGLLLGLYAFLAAARAEDVIVSMLDVGQGDSILIQGPSKTVLIDAGDGKVKIAPLLTAHGVERLDLVIATHPHADHIGGMLAVLKAFPPTVYMDSGQSHTTQTAAAVEAELDAHAPGADVGAGLPAAAATSSGYVIVAGSALRGQEADLGDGATLTVLFPDGSAVRGSRSDLNSNSVVVRLTHGEDCFLFMGDAEEPTERRLLDETLGQCDVLKVAHHGSEYATTPAFLVAVAPKVALISVGAHNSYGHPGPHTVDRLLGAGAAVYRTDLNGEITVRSTGHGERVTTARDETAIASTSPAAVADSGARPAPLVTGGAKLAMGGAKAAMGAAQTAPVVLAPPALTAAAPTAAPAAAPAAATAAAPTAAPVPVDAATCPFPASAKSEVFHEDGCGNAAKVSAENLVCYPTREAAIAAGKRPAGCCKP